MNLATDSTATSLNAWGWQNTAYWLSQPTTLTFAAGTTTQTVTVVVAGDLVAESDEVFLVDLSSAVNASIDNGTGAGRILDNDGAPGSPRPPNRLPLVIPVWGLGIHLSITPG